MVFREAAMVLRVGVVIQRIIQVLERREGNVDLIRHRMARTTFGVIDEKFGS